MKRPSIKSPCVADRYASPGERIAEITLPDGRGLLLSVRNDGTIHVYRPDTTMTLNVRSPFGDQAFQVDAVTLLLAPA